MTIDEQWLNEANDERQILSFEALSNTLITKYAWKE